MFTRFRETARRLQVSLVETHRVDERIRHSHVAGLGSINVTASQADRIAFWTRPHQRLATLANRMNSQTQGTILAAVHTRIPIPTPDEQRTVQLENAKADARFWESLHGMHADRAEGNKSVTAALARNIAADEARAVEAAAKLKAATERVAKLESGEDVPAIGRPMTGKLLMKALGLTSAEARHYRRLAEIGEAAMPEVVEAGTKGTRRAERAAVRAILARRKPKSAA
jgi:hypothetical protein